MRFARELPREDNTERTERRVMARALAALFGCGATLTLLSLLFPRWRGLNPFGVTVVVCAAYVVCVTLLIVGEHIPRAGFHGFLAAGSVCIGVVVRAGGGDTLSLYSSFYVLVVIYGFHFFSMRAAFAHLMFAASGFLAVLVMTHSPFAGPATLMMVGTNAMAGLIVAFLANRVRSLAYTDQLTGLANRRAWHEALEREVVRADRQRTPLCVAILDLDGLKLVNDLDGHRAGDEAIITTVNRWRRVMRAGDVLARLGGDEFGLLLPDCHQSRALNVMNRIHCSEGGLTASSGLACIVPFESSASFVGRADKALYDAKRAGRNRVVVA
jgi:diguanylate cyclase (GGDEF)-like protein